MKDVFPADESGNKNQFGCNKEAVKNLNEAISKEQVSRCCTEVVVQGKIPTDSTNHG